MDRVQVIDASSEHKHFLNQIGQVIMIVDEDQYLVRFADGSSAAFNLNQLRKAN